jgi:predicted  nucleic acid-binding Zn-ribbon protein
MTNPKESKMTRRSEVKEALFDFVGAILAPGKTIVLTGEAGYAIDRLANLLEPDEEPLVYDPTLADKYVLRSMFDMVEKERDAALERDAHSLAMHVETAKNYNAAREEIAALKRDCAALDNARGAAVKDLHKAFDTHNEAAKERDAFHHDLKQIASSLAEFDRVEAIGMQSATMPEKIDALLRDLVRLRKLDREKPDANAEVERLTKACATLADGEHRMREDNERLRRVNEDLRNALTGIAGRADKALSE